MISGIGHEPRFPTLISRTVNVIQYGYATLHNKRGFADVNKVTNQLTLIKRA
jgi:hypothetical protein